MTKVTIINAYGDKNIGDATILNVAIGLIKKAYKKDCRISVLCESKDAIKKSVGSHKNITPFQLPYGYAIRSSRGKISGITKMIRFIDIFLTSSGHTIMNKVFNIKLVNKGFYSYIASIKEADVIVGMGGGYFIAQSTKDYFGLLLTLLPIYIAKIYNKKIIFLPISFGPFFSTYQERLTYQALQNTSVIARDSITLNLLKKIDKAKKIKLSYAPDLALFFNIQKNNVRKNLSSRYITLTAREWFLDQAKQRFFEKSLTNFIDKLWTKHKLKTKFIPMAKNSIEDNDFRLANRIRSNLKNKKAFEIINPKDMKYVQKILKNARVAVCTRMHSAILSSTVHTPFIAIGYGHKTRGFVKILGLEEWHIDIGDLNEKLLTQIFNNLSRKKDYNRFIDKVLTFQKQNEKYKQKIIHDLKYQTL